MMRGQMVFVLALAAALGSAQAAERRARQQQPAQAVVVVPAQYCEKMCAEDFAPCDPISREPPIHAARRWASGGDGASQNPKSFQNASSLPSDPASPGHRLP